MEQTLSAAAGLLLSLLFSYAPKLRGWYAERDSGRKQIIMLGAVTAAALGIWALGCYGQLPAGVAGVSCDQSGFWSLVWAWAAALVANTVTYRNTKYIGQRPGE